MGKEVSAPLQDGQIIYGLKLGRAKGKEEVAGQPSAVIVTEYRTAAEAPAPVVPPVPGEVGLLTLDTREGVQAIQSVLINCGYLDPPADGAFGPVSKWALGEFGKRAGVPFKGQITSELKTALFRAEPLPLAPGKDLGGTIVRAMQANKYWVARHPACLNIVYIEGMNPDGSLNDNRNNVFNDVRVVLQVKDNGVPVVVGTWEATTEPSRKWALEPMNPHGAFHIKFGQYKAWIAGWYHTHEALLQAGEIEGYRDPDKTFKRDFRHPVKGEFGVHHHWGYDLSHDDMGGSSAGCLVGRSTAGHRAFMSIVLGDPRRRANPTYKYMATIMPAGDLRPSV